MTHDLDRTPPVGSFPGSASPFGTFDQGGNVYEWNEGLFFFSGGGSARVIRGGSYYYSATAMRASDRFYAPPGTYDDNYDLGFRLATTIPEPGTGLLVLTGLLGLAGRRRVLD